MIDKDELRIRQTEFQERWRSLKKEYRTLEAERDAFIRKFSKKRIINLTIKEYAIGEDKSTGSFCYLIENQLQGLGNIHGATAFKFGIYLGRTKSDPTREYRFTKKFGKDEREAFENVKKAIVDLLDSGIAEDIKGIRKNPLSSMFKGKILSTYFPDKFLSVFANEHLDHFLGKLGIYYNESDDEIKKRQILIDFKNKDAIMSKWVLYEFSSFLYHVFDKPPRKEVVPETLKEYIESKKDYPKLKDVNAEFIELDVKPENLISRSRSDGPRSGTIDFERENKINKLLGNRGEEIVLKFENEYLKSISLKKSAKRLSIEDDSLGYDILSYEDNEEEKYIEVKSTNQSHGSNANFLISNNQYEKAKSLKNYYFYIVFNAKSKNPKIWKIKNPLRFENVGLTLTPISYRVVVNIS